MRKSDMTSYVVEPATGALAGDVAVPGDKSISHRAAILGLLADGDVVIGGMGRGEDNLSTRRAVAALGARVDDRGAEIRIRGVGLGGLTPPRSPIDCGNAGTGMRLLAGVLAGQPFPTTLIGDESLSRRPMRRIADPLARMGARVRGRDGARQSEMYPPLTVEGPREGRLSGIDCTLDVASAQVKSAVLLAGLFAEGATRIWEPGPSRDHSERMLRYAGAPLTVRGREVVLDPKGWDRRLEAKPLVVPGDPSSAAFLIAAGLLAPGGEVIVRGVCVNETRTGFLDALEAMGVKVERLEERVAGGEPVADLRVSASAGRALQGAEIGGELVVRAIDELPILAVVAARASGDSAFRDAAELRVKESDRIATTAAMLRALGVEVDERPDGFTVRGGGARPFDPARIDAAGDHRIAMSAAVAALAASGPVRIDDVVNVATSFPDFPEVLAALGATIRLEA
jgi:3-phosphoshikimate 1-carboxyvinyltransferase